MTVQDAQTSGYPPAMASAEIVRRDADDDNDLGLDSTQVLALERLIELGAEPAPPGPTKDPETGKSKYSPDPKIRAYQMMYEGRLGGRGRGQGRPREPRAAEVIAEAMREEKRVKKMIRVIDRAMGEDAGVRANLDALKLAMEIERGERSLQIKEEAHEDHLGDTREELLGTIFELVEQPGVSAAIEAEHEEITDAEVVEDNEDDIDLERQEEEPQWKRNLRGNGASSASANGSDRDPAGPAEAGSDAGESRSNGRGRPAQRRKSSEGAFAALARRRASD